MMLLGLKQKGFHHMSGRTAERNSSVELLRLLGMALIVCNHTFQLHMLPPDAFPLSVISSLLSRLGGLGDVLFFGVTAYYLARRTEPLSFSKSARRIWVMERQLLVYAIALFAVTFLLWVRGLGFGTYQSGDIVSLGIKSIFPLLGELWWYPTAYAVFMFLYPALDKCLRAVGELRHRWLACISFALFSVCPPSAFPLKIQYGVLLFIYQYVVFSYVVRHLKFEEGAWRFLLKLGVAVGSVGSLLSGLTGFDRYAVDYLNLPQSVPAMLVGFSLVMLAIHREGWSSPVVNKMASCTFAAYLICCYPSAQLACKKMLQAISDRMPSGLAILVAELMLVCLILLGAFAFDRMRQSVFRLSLDKRKGAFFDSLEHAIAKRLQGLWPDGK